MMKANRQIPPVMQKTSDVVMFNFQRPTRARKVGGVLWLVELYDQRHDVWVWQNESGEAEEALDEAKRLSLVLS